MNLVFDASALLAVICNEKGRDSVLTHLTDGHCLISSVNWAEVISKLAERGMPALTIEEGLASFGLTIAPFDTQQAMMVGGLRPITKSLGLSLSDRCCVALALFHDATVVTAEKIWAKLPELEGAPKLKQLKVLQIR
jgi:ribonuclease VapC